MTIPKQFAAFFVALTLASQLNASARSGVELEMPKAEGLVKGTLVLDKGQFDGMSRYFKKIDALPALEPKPLSAETFSAATLENEVAFVAMNDSCVALTQSGVKYISIDSLDDCVGLVLYHPSVGAAMAHVTIGTNIDSLDQVFSRFSSEDDVQVSILASYKTNLLKAVEKKVQASGMAVRGLWVNNIIQQMDAKGTTIKRFMDPDELPTIQTKIARGKNVTLTDIAAVSTYSSPVGATISVETGEICFVTNIDGDSGAHISSGTIKLLREAFFKLPTFAGMHYRQNVAPNEAKKDVDIAFIQFPVE